MSAKAKPPIVAVEADGWTLRTYRDGSWVRTRRLGWMLETQFSWDWVRYDVPEAVIEQDLAELRETVARRVYEAEKAAMEAILGRPLDGPKADPFDVPEPDAPTIIPAR